MTSRRKIGKRDLGRDQEDKVAAALTKLQETARLVSKAAEDLVAQDVVSRQRR